MIFYHCANASRSVKVSSGKRVTFDVYKYFAGSWLGIAAVEDPETIELLDELVRKPKSGITRITEEEYRANLKKKLSPPSFRPSTVSLSPPQAAVQPLPAGRRAVVAEGAGNQPAPVVPKVYDSVDDFLKIGAVKTLDPGPEPVKRDMGERSDRATGRPSRRPKYRSEDDVPTEEDAA